MNKPVETILILGNGFDLAMGKKTKYGDFLNYLENLGELIKSVKESEVWTNRSRNNTLSKIKKQIKEAPPIKNQNLINIDCLLDILYPGNSTYDSYKNDPELKFFNPLVQNKNLIWLFIQKNRNILGKNWSSLEQIISDLANALSDIKENISDYESYLVSHSSEWYDIKKSLENFAVQNKEDVGNLLIQLDQLYTNSDIGISNFPHQTNPMAYAFMLGEIRQENGEDRPLQSVIEAVNEKLISDLEELTVWLEFYLTYLDQVEYKEIIGGTVLDEIKKIEASKVINFNYTDTITRFGVSEENIHFIHGRINFKRKRSDINRMVFGIEDKDSDLETINVDLIPYQKFYQRVVKETGNQYETFFNTDANKNIVIFGHSVDPLDKEIFQNCFDLADKGGDEYRFIFAYYNEEDKRSMAKNLALILGKNRFITLTGQRKLVFVLTTDRERMREYLLS